MESLLDPAFKDEVVEITDATTGVVSQDVEGNETEDGWQDLYKWQVPNGQAFVFLPDDTFSLYGQYLADTVDLALADDGGSFTDETTEANDASTDDVTLLPAAEATSDAYYFGERYKFGQLYITIGQAGVGNTIVWEYYNGSTWATVPGLTDGTSGLTAGTSSYAVSFTPPTDWARTTVDGKRAYWIRIRCTAASFTTQPLATTVLVNGNSRELADTEQIRVIVTDPDREVLKPLVSGQYLSVKEFQDRELWAPLNALAEPLAVRESFWVVIQIKPKQGVVDVSNGYFRLKGHRGNTTLG